MPRKIKTITGKRNTGYHARFERRLNGIRFFKSRTYHSLEQSQNWLKSMEEFMNHQIELFKNNSDEIFKQSLIENIQKIFKNIK